MSISPITFRVRVALWLRLYLYLLVIFCHLSGRRPNEQRMNYWLRKGLSVKPVSRPTQARLVVEFVLGLSLIFLIGLSGCIAARLFPAAAWDLGWTAAWLCSLLLDLWRRLR